MSQEAPVREMTIADVDAREKQLTLVRSSRRAFAALTEQADEYTAVITELTGDPVWARQLAFTFARAEQHAGEAYGELNMMVCELESSGESEVTGRLTELMNELEDITLRLQQVFSE